MRFYIVEEINVDLLTIYIDFGKDFMIFLGMYEYIICSKTKCF